jgi:hypothetical protein
MPIFLPIMPDISGVFLVEGEQTTFSRARTQIEQTLRGTHGWCALKDCKGKGIGLIYKQMVKK